MRYKDYTDIGFWRNDMDDSVEYDNTGYKGFYLTKNVTENMHISVCSGELDKPKMYISKHDGTFHIIMIDGEIVKDIFK